MSYLIDTDWTIHYLNGNEKIITKIGSLRDKGLSISIVSLAELYLIASTCFKYDLTLLTNNRRHFEQIEGLKTISL